MGSGKVLGELNYPKRPRGVCYLNDSLKKYFFKNKNFSFQPFFFLFWCFENYILIGESPYHSGNLIICKSLNSEDFKNCDAVIVVDANDVLNPAANTAVNTPIYGMPVLKVADAKEIYIYNYDTKPGYAGVDNPLYERENGVHIFLGNAYDTLSKALDDLSSNNAPQEETKVQVENKDPYEALRNAKDVIIVPGYGMAIAQAQHLVKKLQDYLK